VLQHVSNLFLASFWNGIKKIKTKFAQSIKRTGEGQETMLVQEHRQEINDSIAELEKINKVFLPLKKSAE